MNSYGYIVVEWEGGQILTFYLNKPVGQKII